MSNTHNPLLSIFPEERPSDGYHVVQQGEWVSKIAARYGFISNWMRVWKHAQNADLREKRKDPNVLYPGDLLFIPELETKNETCATGQWHKFRLKAATKKLKFVFLDWEDRPRTGIPCALELDDKQFRASGKTDDQGRIEFVIPEGVGTGQLMVGMHRSEVYPVMLGHLDPIDEITGYQQRLMNLGYYHGEIDGIDGPETKAATWSFQEHENAAANSEVLKVDGIMGPKTKAKLQERHGY